MHIINNADAGMTHTRPLIQMFLSIQVQHTGPPPKPIRSNMPRIQESSQSSSSVENINPDIRFQREFTISRRCNF